MLFDASSFLIWSNSSASAPDGTEHTPKHFRTRRRPRQSGPLFFPCDALQHAAFSSFSEFHSHPPVHLALPWCLGLLAARPASHATVSARGCITAECDVSWLPLLHPQRPAFFFGLRPAFFSRATPPPNSESQPHTAMPRTPPRFCVKTCWPSPGPSHVHPALLRIFAASSALFIAFLKLPNKRNTFCFSFLERCALTCLTSRNNSGLFN